MLRRLSFSSKHRILPHQVGHAILQWTDISRGSRDLGDVRLMRPLVRSGEEFDILVHVQAL